jgi:glucuronate isomerase
MQLLDENRLFPIEAQSRALARALYDTVKDAPIVSPHGHTDPRWFAQNEAFPDPATLFVTADHYVFRMLQSQGISFEEMGLPRADGGPVERDPRKIWRLFAEQFSLFRATPSHLWLTHAFSSLFGVTERLTAASADAIYDQIAACLTQDAYRPRALFERFNIEVIATTEGPLDDLKWHKMIAQSGWTGRVITTYRPDAVTDPDADRFSENIEEFCAIAGESSSNFSSYINAHRIRRAHFRSHGATATDHGHPSARTENLNASECEALYARVKSANASAAERDQFRGQMLTEMAKLSVEDGMVMQIHPGSRRNHSAHTFETFGRDMGYDIPGRTDYVASLRPMLDAVGHEKDLSIILFTLDETAYTRELAPLAGVYPCLKLGPAWWFQDSPEGMRRFREATTETAGFYNTVGFNDDTRAFCSIPARHDVARRVDAAFLADQVLTGRLYEDDAFEVIQDLTHRLARKAYRL